MPDETITNELTYTFKVEIQRHNDEDEDRCYQAECPRLTGCSVYAGSETEVIRKMRRAIDVWLDLANRQLTDDSSETEDRINNMLGD